MQIFIMYIFTSYIYILICVYILYAYIYIYIYVCIYTYDIIGNTKKYRTGSTHHSFGIECDHIGGSLCMALFICKS